jgi:hypothetical protein
MFNPEKYSFTKKETPVKKDIISGREIPPKYKLNEDEEFEVERMEEKDKYNRLKKELETQKEGGIDFHFSQFDPYKLSDGALDLLQDYKMYRLKEDDIKKFRENISQEDDDFHFIAMLDHWLIKRNTEIELLKKRAEQKISKLRNNPRIAAFVNDMRWNMLQRSDLKMILDPDVSRFESYQDKIRRYFKNVAEENKDKKQEYLVEKIATDPRYNCYRMISGLTQMNPISPQEIFKY